jgi:hypothetical protein
VIDFQAQHGLRLQRSSHHIPSVQNVHQGEAHDDDIPRVRLRHRSSPPLSAPAGLPRADPRVDLVVDSIAGPFSDAGVPAGSVSYALDSAVVAVAASGAAGAATEEEEEEEEEELLVCRSAPLRSASVASTTALLEYEGENSHAETEEEDVEEEEEVDVEVETVAEEAEEEDEEGYEGFFGRLRARLAWERSELRARIHESEEKKREVARLKRSLQMAEAEAAEAGQRMMEANAAVHATEKAAREVQEAKVEADRAEADAEAKQKAAEDAVTVANQKREAVREAFEAVKRRRLDGEVVVDALAPP